MSKFSQSVGKEQPTQKDNTLFGKIQDLKKELSESQINTAVRRYHYILKTLNGVDFQVSLENDIFYQTIFYQTLLEEKIATPKGF